MQNENAAIRHGRNLVSWGFNNPHLLLVLTMLSWAGNSVVARGIHESVPPFSLAWLRWTIAAMIIMPIAWPYLKRDWPTLRASWKIVILIALLGTGAFVTLYYIGLSKTTAINGVIINSAAPILIPIAVYAIYREMIRPLQATGVLISLVGVIIILTGGQPDLLMSLQFNEGDL